MQQRPGRIEIGAKARGILYREKVVLIVTTPAQNKLWCNEPQILVCFFVDLHHDLFYAGVDKSTK